MEQTWHEFKEKTNFFILAIVCMGILIVSLILGYFFGTVGLTLPLCLAATFGWRIVSREIRMAKKRESQLYLDEKGLMWRWFHPQRSDFIFWVAIIILAALVLAFFLALINPLLMLIPIVPIVAVGVFAFSFFDVVKDTKANREDREREKQERERQEKEKRKSNNRKPNNHKPYNQKKKSRR